MRLLNIVVFLMLGLSAFADESSQIKEAKELIHECDSLFSLTDCMDDLSSLDSCEIYIDKYEQDNDIFYYSQFCKYFLIFTVELKWVLYQLSENDVDEVYYIYLKYYNLLKDEER
jgi:hypothetical protein